MAEIEEECNFITTSEKIIFKTESDGDEIRIRNLELDQGQAASLAWLINCPPETELEFDVKVKE